MREFFLRVLSVLRFAFLLVWRGHINTVTPPCKFPASFSKVILAFLDLSDIILNNSSLFLLLPSFRLGPFLSNICHRRLTVEGLARQTLIIDEEEDVSRQITGDLKCYISILFFYLEQLTPSSTIP